MIRNPFPADMSAGEASRQSAALSRRALLLGACLLGVGWAWNAEASHKKTKKSNKNKNGNKKIGKNKIDNNPQPPSGLGGKPVIVRTSSELKSALEASAPGDQILVAPGRYSGNFLISHHPASGTTRVQALTPGTAVLETSLLVQRDGVQIEDLVFSGSPGLVLSGASRCVVSGNLFTGVNKILLTNGAAYNQITYNDFITRNVYGRDIFLELIPSDKYDNASLGNRIAYNYFESVGRRKEDTECVTISDNLIAGYPPLNTIVEYNLFTGTGKKSSIRIKADGNIVRYNTVASGDRNMMQMNNRQGSRNIWEFNIIDNGRGLIVHGDNIVCRGNVMRGRYTRMFVMAGDKATNHPACVGSTWIGNQGRMDIGWIYNNAKLVPILAEDNTILGHQGRIRFFPYQRRTKIEQDFGSASSTRVVELRRQDVGIQARGTG